MELLLDQGLPRSAPTLLSQLGIVSIHIAEIGLSDAEDAVLLSKGYILVTLDADFHALLALSGSSSPSVIRIEGLRALPISLLLQSVIGQCQKELLQGAMVTVQPNRIRIHLLPILREEA
ncbi:DUF5615 family PIN-like protein [Synechococcus sp. Nb3U1]|uniref:DUF5615 family PIN-like protein n=1 Tax=Synechococcus sp. Nb3U1 TaxID=1914529 RepID=UPI001F2A2128|nr:DUF5615 family PIN-like protein [Synechococcus sp. Nb3U1]MCF2970854.1 DUF5615 family PIN-like protein [Synechococcus sp. Nb3U1]